MTGSSAGGWLAYTSVSFGKDLLEIAIIFLTRCDVGTAHHAKAALDGLGIPYGWLIPKNGVARASSGAHSLCQRIGHIQG